tara:strand:- start:434 stop:787 length:354 start_codon:yes stop_codon:yes gene_type:complete
MPTKFPSLCLLVLACASKAGAHARKEAEDQSKHRPCERFAQLCSHPAGVSTDVAAGQHSSLLDVCREMEASADAAAEAAQARAAARQARRRRESDAVCMLVNVTVALFFLTLIGRSS